MRAHIENYRNIRSLDFEIEDGKINYLFGICGAGKSSIISALSTQPDLADKRVGCSEADSISITIDGQEGPLQDVLVFNDAEKQALFSHDESNNAYKIFIGDENEFDQQERTFDEAVSALSRHLDKLYAFRGHIEDLQSAMSKPSAKNKYTKSSRFKKASRVAQNTSPFLKRSIERGGVSYAYWLNRGRSITDDYSAGRCPFCGAQIANEHQQEIESLAPIDFKALETLFDSTTVLEYFGIKRSMLETPEGEAWVEARLLQLDRVNKQVRLLIDFCNTPRGSLLENGVPRLVVDECLYEEIPELREPVATIIENSRAIQQLLGEMRSSFNKLMKRSCNALNNKLQSLSIPYKFVVSTSNRQKRTADYLLVHRKDDGKADMRTRLSSGERNLVALLLFLRRTDGRVMLIDDPASSFDDCRRTQIFKMLQEIKAKTVLVVSHDQAFAKRALLEKKTTSKYKSDRIGTVQIVQHGTQGQGVHELHTDDLVFFPDEVARRAIESRSYRQKVINLRLLCDLHKNEITEAEWSYLSALLHMSTPEEIDAMFEARKRARKKGTDETWVLERLEEHFGVMLPACADAFQELHDGESELTDFERLIELREKLSVRTGNDLKQKRELLNDLVHMNDVSVYCINPYKYHTWPAIIDEMLE